MLRKLCWLAGLPVGHVGRQITSGDGGAVRVCCIHICLWLFVRVQCAPLVAVCTCAVCAFGRSYSYIAVNGSAKLSNPQRSQRLLGKRRVAVGGQLVWTLPASWGGREALRKSGEALCRSMLHNDQQLCSVMCPCCSIVLLFCVLCALWPVCQKSLGCEGSTCTVCVFLQMHQQLLWRLYTDHLVCIPWPAYVPAGFCTLHCSITPHYYCIIKCVAVSSFQCRCQHLLVWC